ncbi:hypothetical protein AAFF_G00276600 [Aldrovandia affinis]|uniref:Molecule interacting with CasL protein 1 n=1 Tax=Aldrovandia affinis TaxID=143900 RepID=A0AAD7RAP1_9TELE|nr:hypothetical protein AAFF_G00276600 [Aldrovandia affinis]
MAPQDEPDPSHTLFDSFVQAQTCKDVQQNFAALCRHLEVDPRDYRRFYGKLKERLNYWKAKALWTKLDKRAAHPDYQQGQACTKNKCLVLGAGPCGLRTAIELAFLGARVVLVEKRDSFSRNNVLHLWPYSIHDLRGLGAKKFYGKFCCGSLDHISIRQLQLILLKIALLLGVEVHTGVEYRGLLEPQAHAKGVAGWRAELKPQSHPAASFQFDVFISAGGGRFVPKGFRRKELRGKLAIGITANFINRHTAAEAQVAEISGVARIYNQKFFQNLLTETGIDLENIVYYKDDTHYFVMTAKKKSLLNKGVLRQDHSDAEQLLSPGNVDQAALLRYARDAAHFSTERRLPGLEFAQNHAGQPDVAAFDFTCMYRAENASLVRERAGRRLLIGLVGDCLVEPFWPLGTGIARGFLAALDAAWMVRQWGLGVPHMEVMAERESIYQLLSQTTPENTSKNHSLYSIDPATRYPNVNLTSIKPNQVQHLYDFEDHPDGGRRSKKPRVRVPHLRQDSVGGCEDLLIWCQRNTAGYERVAVRDLTQSWRSGLALCALIHRFRPALIDFSSLDEADSAHNNQLAFDVAERELGISPIMSGSDMASQRQPDKLAMVLYLTQFYNAFTQRTPPAEPAIPLLAPSQPVSLSSTRSIVFFLSKLKLNSLQRRKQTLADEQDDEEREIKVETEDEPVSPSLSPPLSPGSSEVCYFCRKRVYVLERVGTEGKFFHRGCFTCHQCGSTLRLGSYSYSQSTGRFFCAQHSQDWERETPPNSTQFAEEDQKHKPGHAPSESPNKDLILGSPGAPRPPGSDPHRTASPVGRRDKSPARTPVPAQPRPPSSLAPAQFRTVLESVADTDPCAAPAGQQGEPARPVPAVRMAHLAVRVRVDSLDDALDDPPPPVPKPRTILPKAPAVPELVPPLGGEEEEEEGEEEQPQSSRPKQSLRKLQLSEAEKNQLVSLHFGNDSDPETAPPIIASSSSSSSPSSSSAGPPKPARALLAAEGAEPRGGSPSGSVREQTNRRSFRRREDPVSQNAPFPLKPRSRFSPWNLSSPGLGREHRLGGNGGHPERAGATAQLEGLLDDDDDDDDDEEEEGVFSGNDIMDLFDEKFQRVPADPVEAQKLELMKMRTLERRATKPRSSIQRRLEEIEVTFKDLEEKGVVLERALRGEAGSGGSGEMIDQWIQLVHRKNALVSEESDLMVASRQLELEDKQSMLEMELRRLMELNGDQRAAAQRADPESPQQRAEEDQVLQEMLEVVDTEIHTEHTGGVHWRYTRLKEINEQLHSVSILEPKRHDAGGGGVHWA